MATKRLPAGTGVDPTRPAAAAPHDSRLFAAPVLSGCLPRGPTLAATTPLPAPLQRLRRQLALRRSLSRRSLQDWSTSGRLDADLDLLRPAALMERFERELVEAGGNSEWLAMLAVLASWPLMLDASSPGWWSLAAAASMARGLGCGLHALAASCIQKPLCSPFLCEPQKPAETQSALPPSCVRLTEWRPLLGTCTVQSTLCPTLQRQMASPCPLRPCPWRPTPQSSTSGSSSGCRTLLATGGWLGQCWTQVGPAAPSQLLELPLALDG